jgi:hypothetical protein
MNTKFKCRCCGYKTLFEEPFGSYEICPVCRWEDDPVQTDDPNFEGGANKESLNAARENFKKFGAKSKDALGKVRKPLSDEIPSQNEEI